jgi:carbonic anhydrase/acetyltransferase-like protein (isoleucine patch superfamily)
MQEPLTLEPRTLEQLTLEQLTLEQQCSAIRTYKGVTPKLGRGVFIDPAAVVIGDVELGDDCSVWPCAVIRGDMHRIRIGARTSVQDGSVLHITHASKFIPNGWPLIIGNDVTIGHSVNLHGCTIGNKVLLGIGSTILDGAVIEDEVVIGAGSLVPPGKTLKSGYMYMGSPAKAVRPLKESEHEFFLYSSQNYVDLKNTFID